MLKKITLLSFLSIPMCFGMEVENGDSSADESYSYSSGESDCTISSED